jgi:RHS repeat-associated protein
MDRTGLVHLRARYYAPYFGAFIQPDSWRGSTLAPDTLHPYLYAGANPVVYRDPSGRCWGPIAFLRDSALYGQTCSNMDMAWTITTSSQATVGQRAMAASYLTFEGLSHTVAIGGSALACLAGGCQAIGGAIGGALSTELLTYGTMTYIGLDAVFIAMDLGAIGYDTYLLISSGSCADEQLRAKLFADVVGLGLDLVAPGLGRGTSGGLRLVDQGGQAAAGALDVARASATVRSLQSVYKILQLGGPTILMASSGPDGNQGIRSSIDADNRLVKEAEAAGRSHQDSLNRPVDQLAHGNMNPGIGTKRLFGSVLEARARDGARVYFRVRTDGIIEILAKSSKSNQSRVISILEELYGP